MAACNKRRKCCNSPNNFCYICGCFMLANQNCQINVFVKQAYFSNYKLKLGDQDKSWAPQTVCKTSAEALRSWTQGKKFR